MRGRVLLLLGETAAAGEHLAVTHDHCAEGVIAECSLRDGQAHEACVRFRLRLFDTAGNCARGDRQCERADRACDQVAPACPPRSILLHVLPSTTPNPSLLVLGKKVGSLAMLLAMRRALSRSAVNSSRATTCARQLKPSQNLQIAEVLPLERRGWIESAKKAETRSRRIEWGCFSLKEG